MVKITSFLITIAAANRHVVPVFAIQILATDPPIGRIQRMILTGVWVLTAPRIIVL